MSPIVMLRVVAIVFPVVTFLVIQLIKRNVHRSQGQRRLRDTPQDHPIEFHAFGIVTAYPAAYVLETLELTPLIATFGVLTVMLALLPLTVSLWQTVATELTPVDPRYAQTYIRCFVLGGCVFLFGFVWLLWAIFFLAGS